MRILIADDSVLARSGLKVLLGTRPDCEICAEATNGAQAVWKAIDLNPDMVILDFSMPGMDGLHAAQEISKALPEAYIVMCTLFPSATLELEAIKYGVSQVISKSEMSVNLLNAIDEFQAGQKQVH